MPDALSVLVLVDKLDDLVGGAERVAVLLAVSLQRDGHQVTFCVTRTARGPLADELRQAGVRLWSLNRRSTFDVLRLVPLMRAVRRGNFDVVHSHMFGSNFWNSVTRSSRSKTATIAHEHTWSFEGRRVRKFLDRNVIAKRCHRIIAVSEHDRQRMTAVVGIPPNAITVIPTATADRHVEGSHNVDIRSDLKLSPKTPIVFTAAMLRSQKRLDVLLRAFALLDGDSPNAHLLIAGGGQLRGELEQLARTLAIHDRVHFLGVRDDISSLAQQSTLGVLSSDFEGMPLFAIECLRAGLPLVATNVGGVPELVRDNMDGVLVSRREPKALARALQDLLASDAQRAELSRNALERSQLFTAERMEQNVVRLYREILESLR